MFLTKTKHFKRVMFQELHFIIVTIFNTLFMLSPLHRVMLHVLYVLLGDVKKMPILIETCTLGH